MKRTRKRSETPRPIEVKEVTYLSSHTPPESLPSLPTKPVAKVYTVGEGIGMLAASVGYCQQAGIHVEVGNFQDNLVISLRGLMLFQDTPKSFRIIPRKDMTDALNMRDAVLTAQKNVLPKKDMPEVPDGEATPAVEHEHSDGGVREGAIHSEGKLQQSDSGVGDRSESNARDRSNPNFDDQSPGGGGA
jgi:hypothetical protein